MFSFLKKKKQTTSPAHFLFSMSLCALSVHICVQVALPQWLPSAKTGRREPPGRPDAEHGGSGGTPGRWQGQLWGHRESTPAPEVWGSRFEPPGCPQLAEVNLGKRLRLSGPQGFLLAYRAAPTFLQRVP